MNIQIINPIEYPNWDELLLTNDKTTFFHTSAWAKVLHESYRYKPLYFTLIDNDKLEVLIPVMEIKSFLTGLRGVSLPFADHCPPIAKSEKDFNNTFNEVINCGKKADWKTIDLKCCSNYLRGTTLPFVTFLTHDLDLMQTEQRICSTLRDSTKRNIKKANQKGLHVTIDNSRESVKEYYKLNCVTRKKHGLPPQPYYFFNKIYEHIISRKKGCVVLAEYHKKVVAGAVFFHFHNQAIFKYGSSDPRYLYLRPNNLVLWKAIQWYCQNEVKTLNFGRTELKNKGLIQFKRGWGATEEILNYYKYDVKKECFLTSGTHIKTSYNSSKIFTNTVFETDREPSLPACGMIIELKPQTNLINQSTQKT